MAAQQAPAQFAAAVAALAGPLAAGAPISTFLEYYSDASQDEFNRQYVAVMNVFELVPGGPTPAQIRELAVNDPREFSLGFATLIVPAHAPASAGMITPSTLSQSLLRAWGSQPPSGTIGYLVPLVT
jgi:hypothetical protein